LVYPTTLITATKDRLVDNHKGMKYKLIKRENRSWILTDFLFVVSCSIEVNAKEVDMEGMVKWDSWRAKKFAVGKRFSRKGFGGDKEKVHTREITNVRVINPRGTWAGEVQIEYKKVDFGNDEKMYCDIKQFENWYDTELGFVK